jgi:hypothetical protein
MNHCFDFLGRRSGDPQYESREEKGADAPEEHSLIKGKTSSNDSSAASSALAFSAV